VVPSLNPSHRPARHTGWLILGLGLAGYALACHREVVVSRHGDLLITGAYAHPSAGDAGAAYFRFRNAGPVSDTLKGVTGPDSSTAMIMGTSSGHMTTLSPIVVQPGERVEMQPGGVHVMFSGLKGEYNIGDTMRVTLQFARAGGIQVSAPVVPFGEMPE
jgi:periplasmic copper chaperone A